MKFRLLIIIFWLLSFTTSLYSQNYQRPGGENINVSTFKWEKYSSGNFDIYYKPNGYIFKANQDFRYFALQNGDHVIYNFIGGCYWQLEDYQDMPTNVELDLSVVTCSKTVYLRSINGGFWIKYKGKNISGLKFIQINRNGTAVYWSTKTGKKYWIPANIYNNGSYNTLYPITSE